MTIKRIVKTIHKYMAIDNIIMERFIAGLSYPSLDYLSDKTSLSKKQILKLKHFNDKSFSIVNKQLKIADDNKLERLCSEYIIKLIKKYIVPSTHPKNSFAYEVGKYNYDIFYTTSELELINEVYKDFKDISKPKVDCDNNIILSNNFGANKSHIIKIIFNLHDDEARNKLLKLISICQ